MRVRVVATIQVNPDEPEAVQKYYDTTLPLMDAAGAKISQRFDVGEPVVGESLGETLMIVEYPSIEALDAVFGSEKYKSIIKYRDKAFLRYNICVVRD